MAGGFVGAYLLQLGFGLPLALVTHATILALRCGLRLVAIEVVRRIGAFGALILGAILGAFGFLPLLLAAEPAWLAIWIVTVALTETIYWPMYHAASAAAVAEAGASGRQLAERSMLGALVSVVGPLFGGALLTGLGEAAGFAIAALVCLLSILPLIRLTPPAVGPVPRLRETVCGADRRAVAIFAAEGWIAAGVGYAWPIVMFASMGASYEAFGSSNAVAGLAGALASFLCGRAIDGGRREAYVPLVCAALGAGILLRAASTWSPFAALLANASGAAVAGCYGPVVYSMIYERAKRTGAAYRFHLAAEAGWDGGAVAGLLAAALVAASVPTMSLAVLPALLGVVAMQACLRPPRRMLAAAAAG